MIAVMSVGQTIASIILGMLSAILLLAVCGLIAGHAKGDHKLRLHCAIIAVSLLSLFGLTSYFLQDFPKIIAAALFFAGYPSFFSIVTLMLYGYYSNRKCVYSDWESQDTSKEWLYLDRLVSYLVVHSFIGFALIISVSLSMYFADTAVPILLAFVSITALFIGYVVAVRLVVARRNDAARMIFGNAYFS